jgi:hypothetical protein
VEGRDAREGLDRLGAEGNAARQSVVRERALLERVTANQQQQPLGRQGRAGHTIGIDDNGNTGELYADTTPPMGGRFTGSLTHYHRLKIRVG